MVQVKWYGVNSLEFKHNSGSFMIDPYVSRSKELLTIPSEVDKYLNSTPDFVLMTHAHWDHLPDMPQLIRKTDTVLYASKTACNIMRALGVPEKNLHELAYGEKLSFQGVTVTALESRHMGVYNPADIYTAIPSDADFNTASAWRCGEVFAFLLEFEDMTVLNIGSANLHEPSMGGIECDYLIGGISRYKEGFPELLMRNIKFKTLIPTHHDEFLLPLDKFHLRNDLERLHGEIPGLKSQQLNVLEWTTLQV